MSPLLFYAMKNQKIDIFISIHPSYAQKIMEGLKTVELRRKFPDFDTLNGRLLIYSTNPVKAAIGFAEIEDVHYMSVNQLWKKFSDEAQIEKPSFKKYFEGLKYGYAIQLKNPKVFNRPLSMEYLSENYGLVPPQSYRYLDNDLEGIFSYGHARYKNSTRYKRSNSDRRQQAN